MIGSKKNVLQIGYMELLHTSVPLIHLTSKLDPYRYVVNFYRITRTRLIWSILKLIPVMNKVVIIASGMHAISRLSCGRNERYTRMSWFPRAFQMTGANSDWRCKMSITNCYWEILSGTSLFMKLRLSIREGVFDFSCFVTTQTCEAYSFMSILILHKRSLHKDRFTHVTSDVRKNDLWFIMVIVGDPQTMTMRNPSTSHSRSFGHTL